MPYEIIQCYLPPGRGDVPPLPQPKLVLDLATPEGCKAELTWMVVISQDSLPAKYGFAFLIEGERQKHPPDMFFWALNTLKKCVLRPSPGRKKHFWCI